MKKSLTVRINEETLERVRDIVYWNHEFTLTSFVELTLEEVVKKFKDVEKRPVKKLHVGRKMKTYEL